jgi:hypothetical protein
MPGEQRVDDGHRGDRDRAGDDQVRATARQRQGEERGRGSEHGGRAGSVVDREQGEREAAGHRKRRHRRVPARDQDGGRRQPEHERDAQRVGVGADHDPHGDDAADDDRDGRVEQEQMSAAHIAESSVVALRPRTPPGVLERLPGADARPPR